MISRVRCSWNYCKTPRQPDIWKIQPSSKSFKWCRPTHKWWLHSYKILKCKMRSKLCSEWTPGIWLAASSRDKGSPNRDRDLCGRISHPKRKWIRSINKRNKNNSRNLMRRKIAIKLKRKKIWEILLIKIGIFKKPFNIMTMQLILILKKFCITIIKLQFISNWKIMLRLWML